MGDINEEVYESNGIIDEKCSLIDEGYWFENDLLLAAELGKTLLERNRDLETQLSLQTKNSHNLLMEIDNICNFQHSLELLKKQLETLRELNRNKMILYEDVDKNSNDLEINNRNLLNENKKQKEKIYNISKKNSYLEQNIDELTDNLSSAEKEIEELKKTIYNYQMNSSLEKENKQVQDPIELEPINQFSKLHSTFCKKCTEKNEKMTVLEIEIDLKNQENDELRSEIVELQKKLRRVEVELEDLKCCPHQNNKIPTPSNTLVDDLYSCMEYDIDRVDEKPVEVGSLDTGGQVFTSTKSMKSIGAEAAENKVPSSLLSELDEKYNNLVQQYETLLVTSKNRHEMPCNNCSSAKYSDLDFQKKLDNIFSEETRRQRKLLTTVDYRPKYKQLFRDAFDILKDMKVDKRSSASRVRTDHFITDMKTAAKIEQ